MNKLLTSIIIIVLIAAGAGISLFPKISNNIAPNIDSTRIQEEVTKEKSPLMILEMRKKVYPGSEIKIEENLASGVNYNRYIASLRSEGLKIFGLLTVPRISKPENGYPAVVFLHGYLAPQTYGTTERYVAHQDGFARRGYVTFKPDLRGHGKSEGQAVASNFSADYITDALNAKSSLQKMKEVNSEKIGMWGHSMGGGITLRSMVVSQDIKAGVIWAGVVGDWEDLLERYRKRIPWLTTQVRPPTLASMSAFLEKYGSPSANPKFWQAIDPYSYLSDISGPIQLHHGTADESVPLEFSQHLRDALQKEGKEVEYYDYPGSDHNIAQGFSLAMQRSVEFFDKYLK